MDVNFTAKLLERKPANCRRISGRCFSPSEKRRLEMRLQFAGYYYNVPVRPKPSFKPVNVYSGDLVFHDFH